MIPDICPQFTYEKDVELKDKQNCIGLQRSGMWSEQYRKIDSSLFPDQESGISLINLGELREFGVVIQHGWAIGMISGHNRGVRVECETIGRHWKNNSHKQTYKLVLVYNDLDFWHGRMDDRTSRYGELQKNEKAQRTV